MKNNNEKRKFRRIIYKCSLGVWKIGTHLSVSNFTKNISGGGICAILRKNFDLSTPVDLTLGLPDGLPPVRCKGAVVWVSTHDTEDSEYRYHTGISFLGLGGEDRGRIEKLS